MKVIKKELSRELDEVFIHVLADTHIGDSSTDLDLLKKRIEEIKNNPKAYCILNGDLINNAIKSSVSDIYSEALSPMQQLEKCEELFGDIKDKILAVTQGNHEARTYKTDGMDITKILCKQLGIQDVYSPTSVMLFLRFGRIVGKKESNGSGSDRMVAYSVYVLHGSRGGRTAGSKINALTQMGSIIDADIYIHSHTHMPAIVKESYYRTDIRNSTISMIDQMFVNTGSILKYSGYAVTAEYKPSSMTTPVIRLDGQKKEFTATL